MKIYNPMWDGNNFALGSPDLQHMSKWGKYWYRKRARKSQYMKDTPKTYKFDQEEYQRTGKIIPLKESNE